LVELEEVKEMDGLLLIDEQKDDQRLGYWIKGCNTSDTEQIKKEYEACWNWIYSTYTGDCLRTEPLKYYNEEPVSVNIDPAA